MMSEWHSHLNHQHDKCKTYTLWIGFDNADWSVVAFDMCEGAEVILTSSLLAWQVREKERDLT